MGKLNCKVGEIWLNENSEEREIVYIDNTRIIGISDSITSVYNTEGIPLDVCTIFKLTKKKSKFEKVKVFIPVWRTNNPRGSEKYTFGSVYSEKDPHIETLRGFIKWAEVEVEIEIDD